MDQALTALLSDHQAKELLAQTLVVMGTECDRNVHMDAGRGGDLG